MNFFQFLAWLISPNIWRTLPYRSSSDQKPNIGKQLFFKNNNIPYETRQRNASKNSLAACDIYTGTWAPEDAMPPYNSSTCPFAEVGFLCQDNGRQDADYLKWKWQPTGCDIPIFDIIDIRRRLKGLRVAFVGDSMGRTQWESFICLLMADIADKSSVFEVHGNTITKKSPYLAVRFSFFNFTVEYYRSPYLVQEGAPPKHVPKRVLSTIKLDKIEQTEARWMQADVLVFNTGHWWTKSKTFARGCYFQVGKSIRLGLSLESAYRTALNTWATWVKTKVNLTKTQVFFRSYEPSHWEGDWQMQVCRSETRPLLNLSYTENFPHLQALNDVIQEVNAPITVLNITSMSAYRQDSHVANWTQGNMVDCGHWCLPGLPDWWNRLFYAALLKNGVGVWA
ncbi:hypothetical protein KP509_14G097700 [Ceratopteris richardii]|uniref:Trichome birefringence-like N-terminal domain-containing protein n=1 Tax=Ceratopteris richardii TaxID=49495 RepID=A0A8T2THV8_CERRI|nr:hypothetical protein KP509_14G097700 [Ceratopteris richardii]KAH7416588.1 hypothetical protein KP509_14G097700 [Ceratopteris richardii]